MDRSSLPAGYLESGEEYLLALRKLGLDPDGLLWAHDKTMNEFVLVLITSQFDFVGPLEIYRLLTRAYNLAATPKEISPFIVRIHSPQQHIARKLQEVYGMRVAFHGPDGWFKPEDQKGATITIGVGDLEFQTGWIYVLNPKKLKTGERVRKWARFKRNVEALAA
jgi:hypothetical protein